MDNYDEKLNYSFEPADPAPAEPAQPLQQAKEEIRRSGRHTGLKIAALLTVVAIVAAAGGYALKQAIAALGEKNLAGQQTSVDAMAEQTVEPEPAAETAAQPTDDKGAYRLERRPLPDTLPSNDTGKTLTPTQVYQMNVGAVCGIATQVTTNVWGQTTTSACTGSGFVLTEDGYIVTNNHVVADANEDSIVVQLYSGEEYPAAIVGTDSMNDVALLKIEAEGLQTVTIGDSDQIEVGETVEAIGNPLGELTFTMTAGYISALDREITPDRTPINMLQTDVAINAGNSGGPLFDMDGNVIGMTTAKVSGTTESGVSIEGLGFAIPINDVMRVVYDLQRYGRVLGRAYLGVTLQDLDSEVAATYNLPAGPQIVTVTEGSCAETAGLQPRDIILEFEDRGSSSFTDLSAALAKQKAGDTVTLKIYRAGAELEITLTLDERPGESEIDATEQQAQAELEGQTAPDTDICSNGGILETKKMGDMAQKYNTALAMHMCETPVAALATTHAGVATENFFAMEFNAPDDDYWQDIVTGLDEPLIQNGTMRPNDKPGLGMEDFNDEVLRAHQWKGSPEIWQSTEEWDKEYSYDRLWS